MQQFNLSAFLTVIILFTFTVRLATTAAAEKLLQRKQRSFDYYDYFDGFHEDPEESSFNGDGGFRPQRPDATLSNAQQQQLNFNNNGPAFATTATPRPNSDRPISGPTTNRGPVVFINNTPTVATLPPFRADPASSPAFIACFGACQTTPEYNPICASNMQLYFNEQKFHCARNCGADIQIVRRGNCEGLFPMNRG